MDELLVTLNNMAAPFSRSVRRLSSSVCQNWNGNGTNYLYARCLGSTADSLFMGLPLNERGLYHDIIPAHSSFTLSKLLNSAPRCIYCGFDPTAPSLHIGNLLTLNTLIHCQRSGHQVIALIGGATGLIGDPSGKSAERPALSLDEVKRNVEGLEASINRVFTNHERLLWKKQKTLKPVKIVNNADWYKDINLVQFLSTAGRHFRMQKLLSRESVRSRLSSPDGMSFQEFSYQIFQAYDFYHLHKHHQCILQLGGSDQLGNLSTGHDFVKRTTGDEVYGITVPLLTTAGGDKLGKSAGNAVWLNRDLTPPFDLYQHFLRLRDTDVERYLRMFTFLTLPEIEKAMAKHKDDLGSMVSFPHNCTVVVAARGYHSFQSLGNIVHRLVPGSVAISPKLNQESNSKKRYAQKLLAEQVSLLVHGESGLGEALGLTDALYNSSPSTLGALSQEELNNLFHGARTHEVVLEPDTTVLDVVERIQCIPPGVNPLKLISEGGLYINQEQVTNTEALLRRGDHILQNNITLIRIGKKNYFIVKWIS